MKVKITKCSKKDSVSIDISAYTNWYENEVGLIFDVSYHSGVWYKVDGEEWFIS